MTTFASTDLLALTQNEVLDGATLHCVLVNELCFKIGQITEPGPLWMEGYIVPVAS